MSNFQSPSFSVGIKLSQYIHENVIPGFLGHATLFKHPKMMQSATLTSTEYRCDDREIPNTMLLSMDVAATHWLNGAPNGWMNKNSA